MAKFDNVSTKCPHCGKITRLQLEQTGAPASELIKRLAGTRMTCRDRKCGRIFVFQPEEATIHKPEK